jgi:hypothetical protein
MKDAAFEVFVGTTGSGRDGIGSSPEVSIVILTVFFGACRCV